MHRGLHEPEAFGGLSGRRTGDDPPARCYTGRGHGCMETCSVEQEQADAGSDLQQEARVRRGRRKWASRIGYGIDLAGYWFVNRIPPRPRVLRIEVTNHCNLRCTFCDRAVMTRPKKVIEWSLFEHICRDALDWGIPHIGLGLFGEVLLHPRLPEMVAFAKRNGARCVEITTNGTLLNEDNIRGLLEAGLDEILVSIDAFERSTYENIRLGASYDEVIRNVHTLLRIRDKLKARTRVQLNFVCTSETIGEVGAFHRYWRKKVDGFFFIPFTGYARVHGMSAMPRPRLRTKCYMLWYMLVASVDGRAGVCCAGDPNMELDVGDLRTRTCKEVWEGPEIRRIRRIHFQRAWKELPVCTRCDMTCPYTRWVRHFVSTYARIYAAWPQQILHAARLALSRSRIASALFGGRNGLRNGEHHEAVGEA